MTRHDGMRAYYERRAHEYDDWWEGTGLFAKRDRPRWHEEVGELKRVLRALPPKRTLDVACGTGYLTRYLPGVVTGLDHSESMLKAAEQRIGDVIHADALDLPYGDAHFERVFTSHFYGHLLEDERAAFLSEARRVGGELVVCDSAGDDARWQERKLGDGSRHRVWKRWFTGEKLARELGGGELLFEGRWFVVVSTLAGR